MLTHQMSELIQIPADGIENSQENINVGSIEIGRILWRMIMRQDLLKVPCSQDTNELTMINMA